MVHGIYLEAFYTLFSWSSKLHSENILGLGKFHNLLCFGSWWNFLCASFNTNAHLGSHAGRCCSFSDSSDALGSSLKIRGASELMSLCDTDSPHSHYPLQGGHSHSGWSSHVENKLVSSKKEREYLSIGVFILKHCYFNDLKFMIRNL